MKDTVKTIKRYDAKTGTVVVYECTYYDEHGKPYVEYRVRHTGEYGACVGSYWTDSRSDAIAHAQFLSRY